MRANLGLVISDGLVDVLAIAALIGLIVVLSIWPRRSRASPPTDVQVRASYAATFAALGWRLVGVSIDRIDRHLFQLALRLEPGPLAEKDLTVVSATATLVGFNATDRWPTLTTFETYVVPVGGPGGGQRIVGLKRGRDQTPPPTQVPWAGPARRRRRRPSQAKSPANRHSPTRDRRPRERRAVGAEQAAR